MFFVALAVAFGCDPAEAYTPVDDAKSGPATRYDGPDDLAMEESDPLASFGSVAEYTRFRLSQDDADPGYPRAAGDGAWSGLPSTWQTFDAGFRFRKNGYAYLFRGDEYIKYNLNTNSVVAGYPKKTGVDGWFGGPKSGFTAVLHHATNGYVYFFTTHHYYRFNVAQDVFEPGARQIGVDGWQGLDVFNGGLDGAVYNPSAGKYYFFKGDQYVRFDPVLDAVEPGYPRTVGEYGWKNVRSQIQAVIDRDDNVIDFIHPPAQAPVVEAVFNLPPGGGIEDATIQDRTRELLDNAKTGTNVFLSVPGWDLKRMATPVVNADQRGVVVRAVAHSWGTAWFSAHDDPNTTNDVRGILEGGGIDGTVLRFWNSNSAIDPGLQALGFKNINHAKVATFADAQTKGTHVSVISSANWTVGGIVRPNSAVIIKDAKVHKELEAFLTRVFALSASQNAISSDWFKFGKTVEVNRNLELYYTPSATGQPLPRDPHLDLLEDVVCTGPQDLVWVDNATWFYSGRGRDILDQLIALKQDGCDVRLIGDGASGDPETHACVFRDAWAAGIPVAKTKTHNKYIIVDAPLASANSTRRKVVAMGSLNFGNSINIDNNAMLEVGATFYDTPAVFNAFKSHWLAVWATKTNADNAVMTCP